MSFSIFREYDIRGIFKKELNEEMVKNIGYQVAKELTRRVPSATYIAIGYDARLHSIQLEKWLTSGVNMAGLKVLDMGMVPTPVNYFANYIDFDTKKCDGSIMITGSHNPPEYNGFKITLDKKPFFGEDIYTLGRKILNKKVEILNNTKSVLINAKEQYIDYMIKEFSKINLKNKKFIFDCGNGVAGIVLEDILKKLNINASFLYKEPDGNFPNHHPDPSNEKNLIDIKNELKNKNYNYGFAYDGDADRIAVLSKKYNFKGDMMAVFFSSYIEKPIVIGEVKCSQIMYDTINKYGKAIMYKTGHSNLKVKIKETNASMAAEVSGHLFFNDRYFGYDDAIYATLRALELISKGVNFDEEYEKLPEIFNTPEVNIPVTEETKFEIIEKLKKYLEKPAEDFPKIKKIIDVDGIRVIFENGWGLIRASNTTPTLVTRFEACDEKSVKIYQDAMLSLLNKIEE